MNAKTTPKFDFYHPTVGWLLGVSVILILISAVSAQEKKKIVIEAGPKVVNLADGDGKPEGTLTKAEIEKAAADREKPVVGIEEVTTREIVDADIDNDGRLERIAVLRKELNVIDTTVGPLIRLNADVLFDFDKAKIKPKASKTLDKVAEFIRLSKDGKVEVAGYTDSIGDAEYNLDLGWKRALAVVDWLRAVEGFDRDRFRAISRGEDGAVAPNKTVTGKDNPEGRKFNRRVEILIRNQAEMPDEVP
ncbi:MAG: OmpA family protein, partial [Verrucomicrobiales bacterium]|nr:OmpA family protein [Verrucomicrobiales bacterium]